MQNHLAAGRVFLISDLCDYEVRRELLRASKLASIRKLDSLHQKFTSLPVTDNVLRRAAEHWAQARNLGRPTANSLSLDADVIIAAQASLLIEDGDEVVIATTNPKLLSLFVQAARWQDIA